MNNPSASSSDGGDTSTNRSIIILDGGTGREIERCGGPFRQPEWSALALYEQPEIVRDVHESFIEAGASAITTNTYAIVPFHLGEERYQKDGKRLLKLAVDLALQAKERRQQQACDDGNNKQILVLGSIPPLCGSYQAEKFDEAVAGPILDDFLESFRGKVDALLLETVGSVREALFLLQRITATTDMNLPVWLSFCLKTEYGYDQPPLLLTGESLTQAVAALGEFLQKAGPNNKNDDDNKTPVAPLVTTVTVNCCDVRLITQAIRELRKALDDCSSTRIRVGAYPNAFSIPPPGAANHTLREVDFNINAEFMGQKAAEWIQAGATVLGGCCGVGPHHIRAMRSVVTTTSPQKKESIGDGNKS